MPSARVRVRIRALVLFATFIFTAPTALAEPPTFVPNEPTAVYDLNEVPSVIARPPAPIELVETGGGYVAAGGIKARVEPEAATFPAVATEQVAARTEYSTTVANPDGTLTRTISLGRINYQDAAGAWQPIDVSLVSRLVDDYELGTKANDVDLRLSKELGADHMVELAAGDYRVRVRVPGLAVGTVSSAADRIAFAGVGTDPGFEILPTPEGFRFQVVIAHAGQASSYHVVLQTVGLDAQAAPDGTIWLVTQAGETVGLISAPTVIDAVGELAPAEAVTTSVRDPGAGALIRDDLPSLDVVTDELVSAEPSPSPTAAPTDPTASPTPEPSPTTAPERTLDAAAGLAPELNVTRVGEIVVTYAVDRAWLAARERVFPVLIDPSVCVAFGSGTGCQGATNTRDVWISSGQPDVSPTVGPLRAGYDGTTYGTTRSEIYFPDVALGDGAVVTSATLQVETQGDYSNRTLLVAPLSQPWPWGDGTWNNQPPVDSSQTLSFTPPATSTDPCAGHWWCGETGDNGLDADGYVTAQYDPPYDPTLRLGTDDLTLTQGVTYDWHVWEIGGTQGGAGTFYGRVFWNRPGPDPTPPFEAGGWWIQAGQTYTTSGTFAYSNATFTHPVWGTSGSQDVRWIKWRLAIDPEGWTVSPTPGTMAMDVSTIVRGWYSRNQATWKPNSGFKLWLNDESTSCASGDPCDAMYFYALDGTAAQRPKLTINYEVHQARVDFDSSLGADFAPATMPAGGTIHLPLTVTNSGSGFSFTKCPAVPPITNCYRVGYRWFDSLGKSMTFTGASGTADLPTDLASGNTSATIDLPVIAPPNPGQYTLRLDLMWMWNDIAIATSDYAYPSKYYERVKDPLAADSNVRWVGSSKIARSEFPIAVVAGGGTGVGETKTVSLPDGSSLGVNLWSKNLRFEGSGGVGFDDLGTDVGLSYHYDSAFRTDCTSSILEACGWGTNFDEAFLPGANGADWIYRDPDGNRFAVDATPDGQLVSGAGVRIDRPRATLIEDNNFPTAAWTGTVGRSTTEKSSGASSISIASNSTATTTTTAFPAVDVSHYLLLSAAVKATGANGLGLGFHVKNVSTGTSGWLYYTVGTDFAIAGGTKIPLGGTVAAWNTTALDQRSFLYDLYSNGFGSAYDHYQVDQLKLVGDGAAGGTAYYDAIRFEGRSSQLFSDLGGGQPIWTANAGNATANTTDMVAGANSLQIAPTSIASSPTCAGCLAGDMNAYPYLHWAWKKVGGDTIAFVVNLKDLRQGSDGGSGYKTGTLTYYAGSAPPPGAVNPIQVSGSVPDHWIYVTRNLLADARSVLGFFDDQNTSGTSTGPSGGPLPDDVQITGYVLVADDGAYALFDDAAIRSIPELGDEYGLAIGDEFVVAYRGGISHRFDREGRLVGIRDLDANETQLVWTYATDGTSEALDRIVAPADGDPLSSGAAEREIRLTSTATDVTFTEWLGSTSASDGRYTQFIRAQAGTLTAVVPARRSASCAPTGASGCLEFTYDGGSSNALAMVADPRDTGSNNFTTSVTWVSGNPEVITSSAPGTGPLFRVLDWDDDNSGWRLRPRYQDANGIASGTNGYARYDDLSPNGSVLVEYAPVACTTSNCGADAGPSSKLVEYLVDGLDNYSTEIRYRSADSTDPVTTRRGTFAAAKVDNFADPLTAGLTAWTQSADQYAASSGPDYLTYRTTYTYNELGQVTHTATPFTNPAGGISTQTAYTVYDDEGHVVQVSDATFLANPGFEGQLSGWNTDGTWTQTTVKSGVGAVQLTGTQLAGQTPMLLPGENFRFQAAIKAAAGSSTGYKIQYETTPGTYLDLLPLTTDPTYLDWTTISYDVTIPQDGSGRIKLTFSVGGGSGTAWVDDVAVFTRYAGTAYLADGRVDADTDVLGRVTSYGYAASTVHPAIFPTSVTRNYVSGQSATADRNVASTAVFDAWGRTTTATDPDGVATDTVYAANLTDVAATRDGLDNATTYLYDEIGQRTSVDDPVHPAATTTYTYLGQPLDVTAPDGVVTHFGYDAVGRQTSVTANYTSGGSGVTGVNNVKTTQALDQFGNVTRTIADAAGGLGTSDVYTDATHDLFGQVVSRTVYEDGTTTGPRTTTAYFNSAGRATGRRGPIVPTAATAPICPPSGSTKCNAVAVLDMNGRQTQATDAYGIVTKTWYDFAGKPVREIRNYVDGVYAAGTPDEDIVSSSRYDTADHVVAMTDVLGRTTSTTYDDLDRIVQVTRSDSSWIKTVYLPSGRTDRTSRPGAAGWTDTQVGWTKSLYDAAGRQTTTLADYDISGAAQYQLDSFEGADTDGWTTSGANPFLTSGATIASDDCVDCASGMRDAAITTTASSSLQGAAWALTGTFKQNQAYKAVIWAKASTSMPVGVYVGKSGTNGEYQGTSLTLTTSWTRIEIPTAWTNTTGADVAAAYLAIRTTTAQAGTIYIDDAQVWDTATPTRHAPTITAFDATNQVVATVAAPGHAGEAPLVTASSYDAAGRPTSIRVNAIDGASATVERNLTTAKDYDALDDVTDETDPSGVITHYVFDRGGHVIETALNFDGVGMNQTETLNVTSKIAYNDRGEMVAVCAAEQVQTDGCDPWVTSPTTAWRYAYDAAGHVVTDTPPDNAGTDLVTTFATYDTASGGSRLASSCDATAADCATPARHTDFTYDDLGRVIESIVYQGLGTGTHKLRTTTTYDGAGQRTALEASEYVAGAWSVTDSLTFAFDPLGRETEINRGANDVTTTTYNPDGTPATRKDHAVSLTALSFDYDLRGNLISTTSPLMTGAVSYAWRLDGLLDSRSWPTGTNSGTLAYDGAKRPTSLTEVAGAANLAVFARTYDENGTVTSETQTVTGIDGDAGGGSQTFTVDPLRRVTQTNFAGSGATKSYAYDANSNRTSQTEAGKTSTTVYDRTGQPRTVTVDGSTANYVADAYGNLTTSVVPTPVAADPTAPSIPTNLVATPQGRTRANLSWSASSDNVGVTSYSIYRDSVLVMTVAGTVTAWSDYSLSPGATYTYTIKANDAAGNASGASAAAQATTQSGNGGNDNKAPSVPTGVTVTAVTSKQLDLTWTASTDNVGVHGYRVYRDSVLVATVGTNSFSDTGLATASTHSYTVAAIDGKFNASAQSSTAYGTAKAPVRQTAYAYDLADRLTGITPATGSAVSLTFDALGRHATRASGGITDTYTYAGESPAIVKISPSTGTSTSSVVDATGARLAVKTGAGAFGWTLADLHGDIAGYASSTGASVTDAVRYDPYGEVVDAEASSLPMPWGYQGRLDLAPAGDTDLLDFGFRPYAPDLGTFTSPDDQAGQALNPLTFNRYLYAAGNPQTLVDPDGHCWGPWCDWDPGKLAGEVAGNVYDFGSGVVEGAWNGAVGTAQGVVAAGGCAIDASCRQAIMATAVNAGASFGRALRSDPGAALSGVATTVGSAVGNTIGGAVDSVSTAWSTGDFHSLGVMSGEVGFAAATTIATGGALGAIRAGTSITAGVAGAFVRAGQTAAGLGRTAVGAGRAAVATAGRIGGRIGAAYEDLAIGVRLNAHSLGARWDLARNRLTVRQSAALARTAPASRPRLEGLFRGERMDTFFRHRVRGDQFLASRVTLGPRRLPAGARSPDVLRTTPTGGSIGWWDLTTRSAWRAHEVRYASFGRGGRAWRW